MRKTPRMLRVEAKLGKPLEEAIPELYDKSNRLTEVANDLGVNYCTLWSWIGRLNIELRKVAEVRERAS